MSTPFPKGGHPGDTTYNGVDCYGGTPGNDQGAKKNKEEEVNPTAALPKGVSEYGGADGNEQTKKKVGGQWQ